MVDDIRQWDSRAPNAVVDPEVFPHDQKSGKNTGMIVAAVFVVFCAAGFLAVYAVT